MEERKDAETTASLSYLWGARHRDDLVRRDRAVGGTTLNETRYVLMDYFSPAAITDEEGDVTERYAFSAFGVRTILNPDYTVRSSSECGMEFSFQGQFLDVESGLQRYLYRLYSAELGRWVNKDPIGTKGGVNPYGFVRNSPTNRTDWLGLCEIGEIKGLDQETSWFGISSTPPEEHERQMKAMERTHMVSLAPGLVPHHWPGIPAALIMHFAPGGEGDAMHMLIETMNQMREDMNSMSVYY